MRIIIRIREGSQIRSFQMKNFQKCFTKKETGECFGFWKTILSESEKGTKVLCLDKKHGVLLDYDFVEARGIDKGASTITPNSSYLEKFPAASKDSPSYVTATFFDPKTSLISNSHSFCFGLGERECYNHRDDEEERKKHALTNKEYQPQTLVTYCVPIGYDLESLEKAPVGNDFQLEYKIRRIDVIAGQILNKIDAPEQVKGYLSERARLGAIHQDVYTAARHQLNKKIEEADKRLKSEHQKQITRLRGSHQEMVKDLQPKKWTLCI